MPRWHNNPAPHRRLHSGFRGEDVQHFQAALEERSGLPVPNNGIVNSRTLGVKRKVFWDLGLPSRDHPITITAQSNVRWPWTRTPAARKRAHARSAHANVTMEPTDGAKVMVEKAVAIAKAVHSELYVVSDYRPGDPKDHGSNDFDKAARDIAYPGIDALKGPPQPQLDDAVVEIGQAFGRMYTKGVKIVDTFEWHGWRVQVIWRTPLYGGHMGHIHCGVHEL